ncbi:class I SAM-dependent methyltransferase [Aeromonas caviae]|uniref:class I SAM-dependent methyltransferase n=1 Tax=Aeromonas caviae TaxID=648 RepID=UPI002B49D981|nr:class I SAM-dependent methyltransferase [Aeromonas caviae]
MNNTEDKILFDQIHTTKKQMFLENIMERTCREIIKLGNTTPKSNSCPICESHATEYFTEKFGFTLSRCTACEHIFCNPMPDKKQLDYYYNSEMKDFENEFFMESFENRVPIFERRLEIIKQYISSGKLLDVGSAIGIFLTAIERQNLAYELYSCDPSASACEQLKEKFRNVNTFQCMVEELNIPSYFDIITMWDTLEHVIDPVNVANKIHSLLKRDGFWFFSTPNTSSFEWMTAGKRHVQILPPGHINLFNPASIKILLEKTGFDLIETYTLNGSLDISYVQKLLATDPSFQNSIGTFLSRHIGNCDFSDMFAKFLIQTRTAGNIFVVAQKRTNR